MDLVNHIVHEDFFLDEEDVTKEDRRHIERVMTEYGVVDTSTFPDHILDLFCVLEVDATYFYCYRSLVQSIKQSHRAKINVMPRGVVEPVYTQADLVRCLNVKNIIEHIL
jgi:hypothetical protein